MPKMATKAADNVFYKARIAAASWNDRLGSREGASEVTGIDRTRLANIELGTINPHPEEVLMLSDTYNAPELQNHFCSHLCPLGIGTISPIELEELERVTLQLISAMKSLPEVKDGIIDIAADGVIDAKEKPRMEQYLEVLDEITNKAQTLKLIYRKQFGKQEVYHCSHCRPAAGTDQPDSQRVRKVSAAHREHDRGAARHHRHHHRHRPYQLVVQQQLHAGRPRG